MIGLDLKEPLKMELPIALLKPEAKAAARLKSLRWRLTLKQAF